MPERIALARRRYRESIVLRRAPSGVHLMREPSVRGGPDDAAAAAGSTLRHRGSAAGLQ